MKDRTITGDELMTMLNDKRDIDLVWERAISVRYDAITRRFMVEGTGAIGISTPDPHDAADTFNQMMAAR